MISSYLKERLSWIVFFFFTQALMLFVAFLDPTVPYGSVLYICFLSSLLFAVFLIVRYRRESAFYRQLVSREQDLDLTSLASSNSPFERIVETSLLRQTEHLQRRASSLKSALEQEKDELLSWIHEMKTPLTAMRIMFDRLPEGEAKSALQYEWLRKEMTTLKESALAEFRKRHLGFIFQDYNLLDTLTVRENVLLPLSIAGIAKKEAQQRFDAVAGELGIVEVKDKYPNEISGGQKQRTSAARAFIHEPDIIFADEPTGALDSKSASDLLNKLSVLNHKRKATIVMVTHDPAAASYSSRVIFIKDGQIFTQMFKGEETRHAFFQSILKTQSVLGGVQDEH